MKIYQGALILLIIYLIFTASQPESLCVNRPYGMVTDVPASVYADANSALVHSSSLGQAPLGDPRYWLQNRSPITQGQYGLYSRTLDLSETQPFDRTTLIADAETLPVYTDGVTNIDPYGY